MTIKNEQEKAKAVNSRDLANEFGFDVCRITDPNLSTITSLRLKSLLTWVSTEI